MKKRVFIIHGWDGYPEKGIFPHLKSELQKREFEVFAPLMPDPLHPRIDEWVSFLQQQVGIPDANTILFGHSIGSQTVLRYLETLGKGERIAGAVFLAGWMHLTDEAYETNEDAVIAKPWLETPMDWDAIRLRADRFIAIFSDDDPLVPITDAALFEEKLGAEIIIEHDKGHFSGSSGIKELSSALEAILEIAGEGR